MPAAVPEDAVARSPYRPLLVLVLGAIAGPGCRGSLELVPSDAGTVLAHQVLDAPNPGDAGDHPMLTFYYGSGTDRRRPEYRDSVRYVTPTVDASKLVDLGESAKSRNEWWGFSPDSFPLNARVWYPDGPGPFPLVLVVHGNHDMEDFSDPGYDWLGEHLASRGFILASVDMNFINGGITDENDARGWLLLQHLVVWKGFNEDPDNGFFGKVDLERIALIGHSRGGEAVGHAAAFNRLRRYPDDASLEFDFGFDIRAIVAIAPVDGQYLPTNRPVPVENTSYLVFHGSHDGDVTSFHGLRQWKRVSFTDGVPRFKAAVYVYRANHGQWNTVWGAHDNGPRSGRVLDLRGLLDPEDQRTFGRVYIGAFLEATLRDDHRYLPLFRDHRRIGGWLPGTMYVTRFESSTFRPVADFEEDIDVTTGSREGVRLRGDSLAVWKERRLDLRSRNRPTTSASQDNQAGWLGWNNRIEGSDTTRTGPPASYTLTLPAGLAEDWDLGPGSSLDLSLAPTRDRPGPRRDPAAGEGRAAGSGEGGNRGARGDRGDDHRRDPLDLRIEVTDAAGVAAAVPLSRYGPIRAPLETRILRRRDLEEDRFEAFYDLVLQSYSIPLVDFWEGSPTLDLGALRSVRLVFDRSPAGTVVVDDIGFSDLEPGYLTARVPPG